MTIKKNIIANYASQIYTIAISIALVPFYIQKMGAEAYGLIGFFSMLQAWFNLLDMGLTPTIARESARYHGGAMKALEYRQIFRALSVIFIIIAILSSSLITKFSDAIVTEWLKFESISKTDVSLAVQIMAISLALRWITGLYRGIVTGAEKLVWLSGFTALIATIRFIGVLWSMWVWGYTAKVFFIYQLIVAALEFLGLLVKARQLLPKEKNLTEPIGWSFKPLKPLIRFSLTIAFTSAVWTLLTQTDKLVLSGILSLAEYGYYTLAVTVAGGIMVISGPVSNAIMPRMARLYAEEKKEEMILIYKNATQIVTVAAGSIAIILSLFAENFLYAWSGNYKLATETAPIMKLYAIGNGFLIAGAFPYYLQYAIGNLRYHLMSNIIFACGLIPSIIFAAIKFGVIGAGWVWLSFNVFILIVWSGYVHHKLIPGLHLKWLKDDILKTIIPPIVVIKIFTLLVPLDFESRASNIIIVAAATIATYTLAAISSSHLREIIASKISSK